PALCGELESGERPFDHRADHALWPDAAPAPARQEHEVHAHLAGRPRGSAARRPEIRLQLAAVLRARDAESHPGRQQGDGGDAGRQLGEEPLQPRAREGSVLVGAELGRDVCASGTDHGRSAHIEKPGPLGATPVDTEGTEISCTETLCPLCSCTLLRYSGQPAVTREEDPCAYEAPLRSPSGLCSSRFRAVPAAARTAR